MLKIGAFGVHPMQSSDIPLEDRIWTSWELLFWLLSVAFKEPKKEEERYMKATWKQGEPYLLRIFCHRGLDLCQCI